MRMVRKMKVTFVPLLKKHSTWGPYLNVKCASFMNNKPKSKEIMFPTGEIHTKDGNHISVTLPVNATYKMIVEEEK